MTIKARHLTNRLDRGCHEISTRQSLFLQHWVNGFFLKIAYVNMSRNCSEKRICELASMIEVVDIRIRYKIRRSIVTNRDSKALRKNTFGGEGFLSAAKTF